MKNEKFPSEMAIFNANNAIKEMSETGKYLSLTRGYSMRPMLREHRDVVVVVPLEKELKKYDVALYMTQKNDLVLHRVLKVREDCYVIRGDNTYSFEYIPKENVIGVLKEFFRNGKHIDCEKNVGYKIYSKIIIRINFLVKLWKVYIRRFLAKIKNLIFPKKK